MSLARAARTLLLPVVLLVAAACRRASVAAPSTGQSVADEIRALRLGQNDALGTGELDRAAALWTEDVSIVAGLGRTITGRAAYRAAFAGDSSLRYARIPDSIVVSAHWPLASELGHWTGRRRDGATIGGTYAAQWLRSAGGGWRIRAELFTAVDCGGATCDWPATAH